MKDHKRKLDPTNPEIIIRGMIVDCLGLLSLQSEALGKSRPRIFRTNDDRLLVVGVPRGEIPESNLHTMTAEQEDWWAIQNLKRIN